MAELERDIEQSLVKMIRAHNGVCLKFTSPGNTGVPDRICILPGRPAFFVELKRPDGGVVSPKQKYWKQRLEDLGAACYIVKNDADIAALEMQLLYTEGRWQE